MKTLLFLGNIGTGEIILIALVYCFFGVVRKFLS